MAQKYKQLHFVTLQSLVNWSVAHLINRDLGFTKKFPFARIGDIITRSTLLIHVEDDVLYKQVTVKTNGGGVVLRNENLELGKNIGTKTQYLAKEGQFIMSKIDARNGAFGIFTNELDGAIVTSDFPLFDVNTKLVHPFYLYLLSTTKPFIQYAQSCSRGTTNRQRIDVDSFLSQKIPLPSLAEQNKIIAAYNATIDQAKQYSTQAKDIDKQIEKYLQEILGLGIQLKTKSKTSYSFLRLYKFSETRNRWDLNKVRNSYKGNYEFVCLSDVASKMSTGTTPPTRNKEYFNGDIDFYTPADIGRNMYLGDAERYISQIAIRDNKARCFYKGDLLFVGIGSTVGKVGLVNKEMVSSNQQITGITFNTQKILPEYAFIYMHYFKENTTANQSKTTLPIVNQEKIAKIPLPLPPLTIQNKIVEHITALRSTQKNLQQKSLTLRQQATEQFEQIIFE